MIVYMLVLENLLPLFTSFTDWIEVGAWSVLRLLRNHLVPDYVPAAQENILLIFL